jgi:type I restriction enzyme S subunit
MFKFHKLDNVTNFLGRGVQPAYDENGIIVFNQRCVRNNIVSLKESRITNPEKRKISKEKFLQKYDVLVNSTGVGTLGRVGQIKDINYAATVDSHVTIVRPNLSCFNGLFFGYAMVYSQPKIEAMGEGTTGQTELSRKRLGSQIKVPIPNLEIQNKIAEILTVYDNLIENNNNRIQILSKLTEIIFREWFIKYRFPSKEKFEMIESEVGLIPQNWEIKPLRELISYYIGGGWGKEYHESDFPDEAYVIRGTDIPQVSVGNLKSCPHRFHKASNLKSRKIKSTDIVFEVSGGSKGQPVGRNILITEEVVNRLSNIMCASFCKLIRPNNELISPFFLDQFFKYIYKSGEILTYQTQSTGISNFKFEYFLDKVMIAVPPKELSIEFTNIISPIYELIAKLGHKNEILLQKRDLILPKLISGQIDITDLDIITEEIES